MLDALLLQQVCGQPAAACNAYDAAIKIAYAVVVTAAIVAVIAFMRKRISSRSLR